MNDKMKHNLRWLFAVIGAAGGYLYWRFVGCQSGHCPLQQNWILSTLWGATVGYLIGDMFRNHKKNSK